MSRYVDYRGNGNYAVVVQTFTNSACTAGAKEQRFLYSINAGTAITPPAGVVLTREPNSFSTITHKVPVALNPGGLSYEVKYARGGVIGPDGGISGPSADAFLDRNTGLADARFTEPGTLRDGRAHQGRRLLHAVERPDQLPGQGAVRPLLRRLPGLPAARATSCAPRCATRSPAAAA